MPYERLDKTYVGGEVWDEAAISRIDDSFEKIYDDLYDTKIEESWTLIDSTTSNLLKPNYTNEYNSSTFSGWWGCVGKPQGFNKIKFPIKPREGYPITSILVKIIEMPEASEVTAQSLGVSPAPKSWKKILAEKRYNFDSNALTTGVYNIIEAEFDSTIENSEGKFLFLAVLCNNLVTMGFFKTTYNDIEYNPWIYYSTSGSIDRSTYLTGTYDYNSKEIYTLPCEFYYKETSQEYIAIGTEKKDKFFDLVNQCINNSESFSEIFQEAYKYEYICGSTDLTSGKASSYGNTTSTFTGVIFPIGVVPKEIQSDGVMLQIRTRSYNDSVAPITKVHAYLYSVDEAPLTEKYSGKQFSTLNPKLLRSGIASCNLPVDEEEIIYVPWDQESFVNTEQKFLMIGYECDTYNYRCVIKKSGAAVCGDIDGNSYGNLETWYSTSKTGGQAWRPRWLDSTANAWSFVSLEKYYDLGEKFYTLMEASIEEKLKELSIETKLPPQSEIRLAKQYDLVVGDKFQLYYEGVIKGFDVLNQGLVVNCSVGKQYPRYWEFEPTAENAGKTYTLKLTTRNLDGSVVSTGSTTIMVHAKLDNTTTPQNLTALIFGDSLTSSAAWAAEGFRRIYGTDKSIVPSSLGVTNTITTYGSKNNTHNGFKIYHEGYGGWTWKSFLTPERGSDSTTNGIIVTLENAHNYDLDTVQKSIWTDNNGLLWELEDFPSDAQIKFNRGNENNAPQKDTPTPTVLTCSYLSLSITPKTIVWETTNPFYNEATESLDFNLHAQTYGAEKADIVACLLTWNGGGGTLNFNQSEKINTHMTNASALLKEIHSDFPDAKIICMGIQISSITGGTGYNYGANGGYADMWSTAFYAFDYDKALEELITTDEELSKYCYYVDTKGQFDTRFCMPYSDVPVNTRSTITEMRGTNGVHPSTQGYYQIGDAFYRILHRVIPTIT